MTHANDHRHAAAIAGMVCAIADKALVVDHTATLAREDVARSTNAALGGLILLRDEIEQMMALVDGAIAMGKIR